MTVAQLFQTSATPNKTGVVTFFYMLSKSPKTWTSFLQLMHTDDPALEAKLQGWAGCHVCPKIWEKMSRLQTEDRKPVLFPNHVSTYPPFAQIAIAAFQEACLKTPFSHQIYVNDDTQDCVHSCDGHIGCKSRGINKQNGLAYPHLYIQIANGGLPKSTTNINMILHQEYPLTVQFLDRWDPNVVSTILSRYEEKGQSAPGFKENILGLKWLQGLQAELGKIYEGHPNFTFIVTKHLVNLVKGKHPADALGGVHIFANGSNLSACSLKDYHGNVISEDKFWSILGMRYQPDKYRQKTSAPKAGNIEATLKQLQKDFGLDEGDLSPYNRVHLSKTDSMVQEQTLWSHTPVATTTASSMTVDALRASARPSKKSSKYGATCFDSGSTPSKTLNDITSRRTTFNPDQFQDLLGKLPEGTKIELHLGSNVIPLHVGVPTTEPGFEMLKCPAGWCQPLHGSDPSAIGLPRSSYIEIGIITHHPGRWRNGGTFTDPSYSTCDRAHAIVTDGIVMVPKSRRITYAPAGSVMFAQFFRGTYHGLDATRQKLQTSNRVQRPADLSPDDVYAGLLLSIDDSGTGWRSSNTFKFRKSTSLRLTYKSEVVHITLAN